MAGLGSGLLLTVLALGCVHGQDNAVYLSLGSTRTITTNNTEILITDIGEDIDLPPLTCHTDLMACCRGGDTNGQGPLGEWYFPDWTLVLNNEESTTAGHNFYRVRNAARVIRLARRESTNPMTPTGSYCCRIPTNGGEMTFCIELVTTTMAPAPVCPDLPVDTNGMITYDMDPMDSRPVGTVATYTCVNGYQISTGVTMTTVTCDASGDWDSLPTCTAVDCGDPPVIDNGSRMFTATTFGSTATYTCENDYTLSGSNMITCQASGSWETSPMCTVATTTATTMAPANETTTATTMAPANETTTATTMATTNETTTATTMAPTNETTTATTMATTNETTTATTMATTYETTTATTMAPTNETTTATTMAPVNETTTATTMATTPPPPPVVTVAPISPSGDNTAGEMFTLTCTASIDGTTDTPTFQWFHDNTEVLSEDTSRTVTDGGVSPFSSVLTFNPLRQSHDGTYTCQVNVGGVSSDMTTTITVKAPTITAMLTLNGSPMAGQSYSLTCTVTGSDSLNADNSYMFTQVNSGQSDVRGSLTTPTLTFDPLVISDAGLYSCEVNVTSPYLNTPETVSSGSESLSIQIPTPTVSFTDPGPLFVGTSPSLTCTVTFDSTVVDIDVTVVVQWDGPRGNPFDMSSTDLSAGTSSHTAVTTLTVAMTTDTGEYTCRAVVSSSSSTFGLTTDSNEGSAVETVTIYPVPSSPMVTVSAQPTSLTFSWTQPPEGSVVFYSITFDYSGECMDFNPSSLTREPSGDVTEFTFSGLQEFSDYMFTITATNGAGNSPATALTATTMSIAPSSPVQNLMVSSSNSSSVSLQWDRVDCIHRNSEITGYSVTFGLASNDERITESISGTEMRVFTASGLIPRTEYTFTVTSVSESGSTTLTGPSEQISQTTAVSSDPTFQLDGVFYQDHSIISPDGTGDGSSALHCITPYLSCCGSDDTGAMGVGQWFLPNGGMVPFRGTSPQFYMARNPSRVSLNRQTSFTPTTGVYRCQIPVGANDNRDLYIGLYPDGQGVPTINTDIVFNRDSLTLTCTSTGGPASEVIWTRDGVMVTEGSTYSLTQTVTNTADSTYENVLTATDVTNLVGNFSCTVNNVRDTSNTQTIMLSGVRITGPPQPFTVGGSVTLTCDTDIEGTIEWLDPDMNVVESTASGQTLDYTISPISDSLHNSEFTCRTTGGSESITISVDVPDSVLSFTITEIGSPTAGSEFSLRCEVTTSISGLMNSPVVMWIAQGSDITVTSPSDGVSVLTFSSLRTLQGTDYTCQGSLTSPALNEPLVVSRDQTVVVEIPTPEVSVATPTPPLYAATPLSLTCTVTVDNAVDIPVVVDVTWEITRESGEPVVFTSVASGSVPTFTDTLNIAILNTRDNGVICRAVVRTVGDFPTITDSPQGSNTVSFNVSTPPPPEVTITVTGSSIAGSSLSLLCTATLPFSLVRPPTVTWVGLDDSDTDVSLTSVSSGSESNLTVTFDPLRASRGGIYACRPGFNVSEAELPSPTVTQFTTVNVQIPQPTLPPLRGSPVDSGFSTGRPLDLICEVELDPSVDSSLSVNRTWTKDGDPLTPDGTRLTISDPVRTQESPQVYQTNVSFNTLDARNGDSGNYGCMFTIDPDNNQFITGTTAETNRNIVVEDFPVQRVVIPPEVTVPAGSPHTLTCTSTKGEALPNAILDVEWFDPLGSLISGSDDIIVMGEPTTTDFTLTSSLMFSSLMTSQAGPYTCSVNLTIPGANVTDHNVRSTSIVKAQIPPPQSVTFTASRSEPHYEGTTGLVLTCTVHEDKTGVDTATMVDRTITPVSDSRLTVNDVDQTTSTLTFSILGTSDNGLYTCNSTVSTTLDVPNSQYIVTSEPTQETITVTVTALPVPTVVISPFSIPTSGGRSVLTCTVTVEDNLAQQPTLQWTNSNGHTQMDGVTTNRLTSTLTFDPLLTSNGDQYTCSARIDIPQVGIEDRTGSQSVNLPVQIPSPTVDVSESQSPTHGTNHTFMCIPTIDSSVNSPVNVIYSWTGPQGPLTNNDNYTIVNTDSSSCLTLTPVDQPDISSGNYTCTVIVQPVDETYISQVTNSGFLNTNVLAAPPPIPTSAVTRESECGQVTSLTCSESVMTNFVSRPVISWVGPNNQTINGDTLTSSELTDTGTYTCMICVTVSKVNINNLCGSTTVPVTNTVPGPVNSLSCRDLSSSTSLGVFWGPPSDNSQSVVGYQVEIRQYISDENKLVTLEALSEQFNKEITFLETSADGLELGVRYSISVEAVSSNGCGSERTMECYTEEGAPSMVTGVTVDRLNGTAMNVSWEPLTIVEANGFLRPYIVTITRMSASSRKRQTPRVEPVSPDESNVIIGGLDPEDNYGVTVTAETGSQRGLASTSIVSGLPPSPPAPSNIAGIVGGIIVAIVFVIIVIVTIIVVYYIVRKNQGKGKFKVSTSRAYEMTTTRSSNVEPTSARPRSPLGDDLDNMESEKSKEAAAEGNEVTHQVTSAEVLDRMKPISLTSFRAHVQEMHDDRAKGFEAEYQSFSLDPLEDHEIAKIPYNRIKNRFANIFPYDHSRVTLKAIPGVEGSEYINACFMHGYQRENCYIAAQGPMPNSLDDFWRMVWEYKLVNIVMLTKCKEGGRVKCEQYWSEDIGSVFETEKKTMIVTTLSVVPFADFVIRQFTLKNTQEPDVEPLKVTQFHFTSWPDHGVPKFATSLISFIRKVQRGHNKDNGVPLLVHCSAGVGRTGTFITLDSMLERIHKETSVNVYQFIKQMRTRRVLMVQTLAQYTFIHDALGELITCGETDIAAGVLRTKVNLLAKSIPGKGITGFTNQFQLLAQVSREPDPEDVTDALEHYNKDKNRYIEKIPYNMSRARLRPTGEDGSEYINASFVDGYKQRNAYIATQGPLKHTVADLWRMIWEFKSKTLVMVCNMEEEGQEASYPYWPVKEDEVIKYGKINVTLQSKAAYGDFTVRKFTIHEERPASAKQLEGFTVTQFHHTEWPPHGRPKTGSLIEMLDMITKSQMSTGNRPITVMCNDGIGRTGTFICVHAQLERLKTEGVVDFFQSIKSARIQRAGLVPDVNQYALCHEVLADYIDKFDNYANFKDMI